MRLAPCKPGGRIADTCRDVIGFLQARRAPWRHLRTSRRRQMASPAAPMGPSGWRCLPPCPSLRSSPSATGTELFFVFTPTLRIEGGESAPRGRTFGHIGGGTSNAPAFKAIQCV
eukprot:1178585-Prorocentrum_minimum.AAC.5